jgi:MFS family permease
VLSPVVVTFVDRFGPRRVILSGTFVLGAACLLGSRVGSLWALYLITGVLSAVGVCAVSWVPSGALIARWFAERRGSMMGIAFSGTIVRVDGVHSVIDGYVARRIPGAGVGTCCWCPSSGSASGRAGASAPRRGDAVPPAPAPGDAAREIGAALQTRAFWALFFAYLCTPLAVFPVVTHQVALAVDQGFPRLFVAGIFGVTGLLSVVGWMVLGIAADRIGRAMSATISYGCTAAGTLCLLGLESWRHAAPLYAYALLFGLGFGARGPIITAIASQLFHGRRFGVIYGILSVGNGIGGGIAPWFGGAIHDVTGSYRIAFLIAVGFCAMGATCFWLARPPRHGR